MPTFRIEQYELHTQVYSVEAANEAEAIKKLLDGEGEPIDGTLEFIEVAADFGLPVECQQELANQVRRLGVAVGEAVIPSIRSIEESQ